MKKVVPVIALVVLVSFCQMQARACECSGRGAPVNRLDYANSIVFVATAVSVDPNPDFTRPGGPHLGEKALARIDERLWGVPASMPDLFTLETPYPCDWLIQEGEQYLVAVPEGNLVTGNTPSVLASGCTRTRLLKEGKTDLRILRDPKGTEGRRVVGQVLMADLTGYSVDYDRPIAGAVVVLKGPRSEARAITDADGLYDITGLPAGSYVGRVTLPAGLKADAFVVDLIHANCADGTVQANPRGRVQGFASDLAGHPAEASIEIVPAVNEVNSVETSHEEFSDRTGRFDLKNIPPGDYWLAVNLKDAPSRLVPFDRAFYPGTPDLGQATKIHVGTGTIKLAAPFRLTRLPSLPINVLVTDSSHGAVSGATVTLMVEGHGRFDSTVDLADTDASGHAHLVAPEERNYTIRARVQRTVPGDSTYHFACSDEVVVATPLTSSVDLVLTHENCAYF